ncbi:MAG TPA: AraC family transcriptional regulator [Myxococcales bacterium]|nr:AraC family transcriptional regulator [Myxococcales bacterium]
MERIEWGSPPDLPGVVALHAEGTAQLFRHFYETYAVCNMPRGPASLGTDWIYRGQTHYTGTGILTALFEPGETHRQLRRWGPPTGFDVFFFDAALVREAARQLGGRPRAPHFSRALVGDPGLYRAIQRFTAAVHGEASRLERESRLVRVLERLVCSHAERSRPAPRDGGEPVAVARIRAYLHDHLAENVSLAELALEAGLSRFHVLRVFKRATGSSPHEYQLLVRICAAMSRLERGERPAEVAATLGFADQSHFGRHFRRIARVAPSEFAKAVRGRRA